MSGGMGRRRAVHAEQVAATEDYLTAVTREAGRAAILRARAAAAAYDELRFASGPGRIDRVGQRFGVLLVEGRAAPSPSGQPRWLCLCGCGRRVVIYAQLLVEVDGCVVCRAVARMAAREKEREGWAGRKQQEVVVAGRARDAVTQMAQVEDVGRWVPPVLTPERRREVLWQLGRAARGAGEPWREVVELCGEEIAGELRAAEMMERGEA